MVGADSPEQLRGTLEALESPLDPELARELGAAFDAVPAAVRDPRRWTEAAR